MMREKTSFRIVIVAIYIAIIAITAFLPTPEGLSFEGKMLIGILIGSIIMWITEAIPILATTWLFAAAVPLMGVLSPNETWAGGVSVAMVLCLSCFAFALFFQKSTISLRIVAAILAWSKNDSKKAIFGMMLATGLFSLIIDDLILVLMMLPFAYTILDANKTPWGDKSQLAKAMIIGIVFASYIGGWITPAGSVVNVLAMGFAEQALGVSVTFANWMVLGTIVAVPVWIVSYLVIVRVFKVEPITDEALASIAKQRAALPGLNKSEIWGLIVIIATLAIWILSSWFPMPDMNVVGLIALALLFIPPFNSVNFKEYATESAWQVVMLNWGVGCFVAGMMATGAISWFVNAILGATGGLPVAIVVLLAAIFACIFHNILPAGAAVAGMLTIPICSLIAGMGGNITASIVMVAVFSCAAFLIPLDLCIYVAYSDNRKYLAFTDEAKAGAIPTVATIAITAFVLPVVCAAMGLA